MLCSSLDLRMSGCTACRGLSVGHMKSLREQLCSYSVLTEIPISIFLCSFNYSFCLVLVVFITLPLFHCLYCPVFDCFSCNRIGFCCCFSLIGFTGMNADWCSHKWILTASHPGFPKASETSSNFYSICLTFLWCLFSWSTKFQAHFYSCRIVTARSAFQQGC